MKSPDRGLDSPAPWQVQSALRPTFGETAALPARGGRGAAGRQAALLCICNGGTTSAIAPSRIRHRPTEPGCGMAALPLHGIIRLMSLIRGDFNSAADLTVPDKVQSNSSSLAEDLVTSVSHLLASNYARFHPSCYLRYGCQLTSKHCQQPLPAIWEFQGKLQLLPCLRTWTPARHLSSEHHIQRERQKKKRP